MATLVTLKTEKRCKTCGAPIVYGINGAQMLEECLECYRPSYFCRPTPVRSEISWDELDAMEDRCLGDDWD